MLPKKVKNKHIERIKRQEPSSLYSSAGGMSGDDFSNIKRGTSKSSSDIGGSNSTGTLKDYS